MQNTQEKQAVHNLQKLIVLGAGDLTLKSLQVWSDKKVILVDASDDVCNQLNALVDGLEEAGTELSVQNVAIADKQETRTFRHLNLPELSGFNLPVGLQKLYPGLKTLESQSMQAQSLQGFLANQDFECDANCKNGLIIDIPTQLDELLKALLESEFLSCFKEIQFSASSMPLDKDVQSIEQWLNQFQAQGFELQNQSNLNDDFINYTMVKNPLFNQLQTLKQQLQQQQAQNEKLETQANEMAEILDKQNQLISTKDKELKDYQAWLSEAKQALATESDALNSQLAKLKQENDALKEQNAKQIETLKSEWEHIRAERDSALKERDDLKVKLEQKDKQVITLSKQLNDTQVQLNNVKKQNNSLHSQQTQTIVRQKQLESQLTKAEAQIDIIKTLLIKPLSNDQ